MAGPVAMAVTLVAVSNPACAAGMRRIKRGKDAGSPDSRRLSGLPRTQHPRRSAAARRARGVLRQPLRSRGQTPALQQLLKLVGWQRAGVEEALAVRAAKRCEVGVLLGALDALGHDAQLEARPELDDGARDRGVLHRSAHAFDERLRDLQAVERKAP